MIARVAALVWLALLPAAPSADASWRWEPLEVRLLRADLVVVGRIERVERPWLRFGRYVATGDIDAREVVAGPSDPGPVRIAWGEPGWLSTPTSLDDFRFATGQEGIWILEREGDTYTCPTPGHLLPREQLSEVRAALATLRAVDGRAPDDGAALTLALLSPDAGETGVAPPFRDRIDAASGRVQLFAWLVNAGGHPISMAPRTREAGLRLSLTRDGAEPSSIEVPSSAAPRATAVLEPGGIRLLFAQELAVALAGEWIVRGEFGAGSGSVADHSVVFTVEAPEIPDGIAALAQRSGTTLTPLLPTAPGEQRGRLVGPDGHAIEYFTRRLPDGLADAGSPTDEIAVMQSVYAEPPFEWVEELTICGEPVRLALTSTAHERAFGGEPQRLLAFYPARGLNLVTDASSSSRIDGLVATLLSLPEPISQRPQGHSCRIEESKNGGIQ